MKSSKYQYGGKMESEKQKWKKLSSYRKGKAIRYVELTMNDFKSPEEEKETMNILRESMEWDDWDLADTPDFIVQETLKDRNPHMPF